MARRTKTTRQYTGLHHAREARGITRSDLGRLSGVSKQQLSRLENGQIRLRLDHLKPFASHLGYTPEQILLWGRYPGTSKDDLSDRSNPTTSPVTPPPATVPELDTRIVDGAPIRDARKGGSRADPMKGESWSFPPSFVHEQLHSSPEWLLVVEVAGDSMAPTIASGERVIIDTGHTRPSPDGIYAIRDSFNSIVVRRLQVLRATRPTRAKVLFDNSNHPSEEAPLGEIEIVGKVVCCLKLF
jgi:phage repressor protein C with HTH and peptisase S24 domain